MIGQTQVWTQGAFSGACSLTNQLLKRKFPDCPPFQTRDYRIALHRIPSHRASSILRVGMEYLPIYHEALSSIEWRGLRGQECQRGPRRGRLFQTGGAKLKESRCTRGGEDGVTRKRRIGWANRGGTPW